MQYTVNGASSTIVSGITELVRIDKTGCERAGIKEPVNVEKSEATKPGMIDPLFVRAGPADLEIIFAFVKTYYEFDGIRFQAPDIRSGLEALLRDTSLGLVWLIRAGDEDLGYVVLTFGFDLEFGGRQATVTDLYIAPQYRRLGLGTRTLHFVEAACRELGIGALELQVERGNTAAQALYRKLGFERHDRIPLSKLLRTANIFP